MASLGKCLDFFEAFLQADAKKAFDKDFDIRGEKSMEMKQTIFAPMIALRGMTIFPGMAISFPAGRQKSLDALQAAEENGNEIFLVTQKNPITSDPSENDLYDIGVLAELKQVLKLPGNLTHVVVEGKSRARLLDIHEKNCEYAEISTIPQDFAEEPGERMQAIMKIAVEEYDQYLKLANHTAALDLMGNVVAAKKPGELADVIAAGMELSYNRKQEFLEQLHPYERLEQVILTMQTECQVLEIKREIEGKTKERIDKNQREYYLREEMKVIQKELGDKDSISADAEQYQETLEKKNPPAYVRETIEKEIDRMRKIPITSPEANVSRTYIETLLSLPWREATEEFFDLAEAEKILDEEHYGMKKVKERILEYLAVRKNAPEEQATILCLVGPPGVGKTSIARSVAKALNRKYVRMSLGGVRDEAEIRGHRKTYIGAMPGRIIHAMKQAGTINPLMLLDEVDKLGASHNGDPAAALLEVLDGEQNSTFRDHFVELPYDLSKVLFMCTANSLDTIPGPLRDRMELITLSSYTAQEKLHIAQEHLLEKERKRHGLRANQLKIKTDAMEDMIDGYTREAGVRQLERAIGEVCRKAVKMILSEERKALTVTRKNLEDILGTRKFMPETLYQDPQIGIVRGLAWTSVGGTTLSVEVNCMPGDGKFKVTGNLGRVMQESAEAAISYIRSQSERFHLEADFYKKKDIHIHIPEGATPKDGPSAGVTMATAIISALTGIRVRNDVAMTGEITIRGRVLPIGGLQEKVLAAKKIGIQTVVLPKKNEKDLNEIMEEIRDGMQFVLAETMEDVLQTALVKGEQTYEGQAM